MWLVFQYIRLLIFCVYWVLSYIIHDYSCLIFCIFTKLSQIVCLINVHISLCLHIKIWQQVMESSMIHQTFTDCVLKQKCRDEKWTFVSIYGYISSAFSWHFMYTIFRPCCKLELLIEYWRTDNIRYHISIYETYFLYMIYNHQYFIRLFISVFSLI